MLWKLFSCVKSSGQWKLKRKECQHQWKTIRLMCIVSIFVMLQAQFRWQRERVSGILLYVCDGHSVVYFSSNKYAQGICSCAHSNHQIVIFIVGMCVCVCACALFEDVNFAPCDTFVPKALDAIPWARTFAPYLFRRFSRSFYATQFQRHLPNDKAHMWHILHVFVVFAN